jgi:hypothetical protein
VATQESTRASGDVSVIRPRMKVAQHRAARKSRADLPWLSTVRLPWGLEVRLLNISTTGMLVETSSKFTPGSVAEFELRSAGDSVVVPARFVRSEVVSVDGLGVRYRAAAVFERELDLDGPQQPVRGRQSSTPGGLADWLVELSTLLNRPEVSDDASTLRERMECGLRRLVSAKDVRILDVETHEEAELVPPPPGCKSIYFSMGGPAPGESSTGRHPVLQVTFEPDSAPSDVDLRLLQAGAALAAVVMLLNNHCGLRTED